MILWDECPDREQEIGKIIKKAGIQTVVIGNSSDLNLVEFSAKCFIAVASTGAMAGGAGMQVIRDLKAKGFKVIAYGHWAGFWPIKTKCLPLLAGAVQLFDSSTTEFLSELQEIIERIVPIEIPKPTHEHNIKAT